MTTEDNLRDRAKEIRGAFEPSSVTNEAVGGLLLDIINFFIDYGGSGGGGGKPDARYWSKEELKMLDQYLYVLNDKIKALYADSAGDSELFKGHKWEDYFDQPVRTTDDVNFKSVTSTDFESKVKGWIIDALGDAEFRDVLLRSFKSWNFAAGPLGAGVGMVNDDELQTDKLLVRKIMYVLEMMIQRMRFQGGQMVLSQAAGFKVNSVEVFDTYYRLRCHPGDFNEFEVNDQARVQNFTGNNIKYLWSLVLSRGDDYIDISRVDKDGEGVPAEGDEIVQLGNRTNPDRQDAVLLSAVNGEVGIFTYYGINSFDLSNKEGSWLGKHGGKKGAVIRGEVHITAGSSGLEQFDEYDDVDKRIQDAKDSADSVQEVVNNLTSIIIPDMQGQIDGSIMSHEGKVPPTLTNEPAVNWTTEEEKNRHIGDYYDYYLTVDGEQVTERYKFSKVNGTYQWVRVADSGSALAASVAREALGLAGTKATITWGNTLPEAPYNINDMWIKLDGSMYICNHQRLDGETGSQSDWQLFNDTMLRLAKMADDNVITKEEKATLRDTWNQIQKEFTAYQAQATKYGVSITALQNAYNTLNTFLTNTVKIAQDIDSNLSVAQKTEYNQDFANYYSERTAFANVIAQKVADESVGNLQIGGINLADYSGGNFLNALGLYDSSYASKGSIDRKTCLIFNRNSANCRFAPVTVENGEYTFSIWVKGSEEYDAQVLHYDGANYGATTVHVTTSWERKVMTFTAKAGTDVIHWGTKNTIYIADWKYEKGNKVTDWSPSIADQNRYATEQGEAAVDNLQVGSVNLVSRKMMLTWNEKNKDIALWGQDSDGIYLGINQGALYTYVCGGSAHNDLFGGTIKYKGNTQYVFQVKWKLAGKQTNNNSGVSFWALYTDGTTDGMRLGSLQTSLIVESFITKKGKTVEKIFSSYGDNKYRSRVYSLALYEGNKALTEIPVATEDLQGQSNVNLVDGGKEVTVTAGASSTHSHTALVVPKLKPNTVYHLSFNASNLVGSPDKYGAILYNYENSTQFNDTLNSTSGGIIITRNNFTEGAYHLLLYAGATGSTNGNSVKFTEVMLVEGFTPPSSYSPSPGDVQKEIEQSSTITKDDFAKEMGYESFQDMADKATGKGGKLVVDGLLNANLIDVETLAANNAFINKLSTNILTAGSIKASMLSVAGFTFEDNNIYSGSKFGEGAGVNIVSNTSERAFKAYKDENNFVSMFYNRDTDWGLKGVVGSKTVFQLGNSDGEGTFIGPFNFTETQLVSSSDVTIGGTVYKQGFTLENNRLSFHRAVSSIYQRGIQMGVTNGTNYGTDTLFAVEGGDIYHQGTVTTPSGSSYTSRACRFYASDIIARGLLELKSQLRFNDGAYESAYPYSWSYSSNGTIPTAGRRLVYVYGNTGGDNPCTLGTTGAIDGQVITIINTNTSHRLNIKGTAMGDHWIREGCCGTFRYLSGFQLWYPERFS